MSVPHSQQQGEKSVHTYCGRRQQRYSTQNPTKNIITFGDVVSNVLAHLCYMGQEEGYIEWLYNKCNTKISDRQASKEEFGRRINRHTMKSTKDQSIAKTCGDG